MNMRVLDLPCVDSPRHASGSARRRKRALAKSLMTVSLRCLPALLLVGWYGLGAAMAQEQPAPPPPPPAPTAPALPDPAQAAEETAAGEQDTAGQDAEDEHALENGIDRTADAGGSEDRDEGRRSRRAREDVVLHIGNDSQLRAGQHATAVISILGSSTSAGEVDEAVISIFGNTRVTGRVGEAAIALFGNNYIDSTVAGDAIAVFGNLVLGPRARIDGEAVVVGGRLERDPQAIVRGGTQEIAFGEHLGHVDWLRPWLQHGLLYGRPLAFQPGLGWAWVLALGALALYVLISLLFGRTVDKCVATLESQPGQTAIAAVLTVLLVPMLILLLLVTVIGIPLVPLLLLGLFCASLFGKSVVLAALGRRLTAFTGIGALGHVAVATLVGGLLLLLLYAVPVVGFIAYNVLGILAVGIVVYSLLLALRTRRPAAPVAGPAAPVAGPAAPGPGADVAGAANASAASTAVDPDRAPDVASAHGEAVSANAVSEPESADRRPPPPADEAHAASAQARTGGPAPAGAAPAARTLDLLALPRAGFGIRMAALLIDAVLIMIIVGVLSSGDGLYLLLLAAYGAVMWKLKGTTVGGILCNLAIVRLDGRELGWDTSIVRALSCFLSLAFVGLGFFWILFDDERQSWHDKIAGTVVVRTPKGTSLL